MDKSPFKNDFVKVCFVAPPRSRGGEQHIFVLKGDGERQSRSICGKTAHAISHGEDGQADAVERKERDPERPVCQKCDHGWKAHPGSPWRAWARQVEQTSGQVHK